jgi:hypothetical protein
VYIHHEYAFTYKYFTIRKYWVHKNSAFFLLISGRRQAGMLNENKVGEGEEGEGRDNDVCLLLGAINDSGLWKEP